MWDKQSWPDLIFRGQGSRRGNELHLCSFLALICTYEYCVFIAHLHTTLLTSEPEEAEELDPYLRYLFHTHMLSAKSVLVTPSFYSIWFWPTQTKYTAQNTIWNHHWRGSTFEPQFCSTENFQSSYCWSYPEETLYRPISHSMKYLKNKGVNLK